MNEPPTPNAYWDAQERIGQAALSSRDTLVVSTVRHGDAEYLRLQVHRIEIIKGTPRSTPGQKGVILPLTSVAAVMELLAKAMNRRTAAPHQESPEE